MTAAWHVPPDALDAYAERRADAVSAASVEAHLLDCPQCRATISATARTNQEQPRLDAIWAEVVEAVDAPKPSLVERLCLRLGLPDGTARLLGATPSLRASWLGAVALTLAFVLLAAHQGPEGMLLFLLVAPVLPLAGVAAAYGPGFDPTHELALAAPLSTTRLLFMRAMAVLGVTLVLAGAASLGLPHIGLLAGAWALPALALAAAALAASTWFEPTRAAITLAVLWVAVVVFAVHDAGRHGLAAVQHAAVFQPAGQATAAAIAVAAAVVVARRRSAFETGRAL
jgi:hypothetical protein